MSTKSEVKTFWESGACGEIYAIGPDDNARLDAQAAERYTLEPYIAPFADFPSGTGKDILEIGVGMGADHLRWAQSHPRSLTGIDLTERAITLTSQRLAFHHLHSTLKVADAEHLPFPDHSFDIVYSYGVLHHSPDTPAAINEVHRVLKPGGTAKIMIYHSRSLVGYMLWARYALLAGHPARTLADIYASHLESPGTKAYTMAQAAKLFEKFSTFDAHIQLGPGDLLTGGVGQRHRGPLLSAAKALYPRPLIRKFLSRHGLGLMISATK